MAEPADVANIIERNEVLTEALDTMSTAFIVLKDGVCVYENVGFRKVLGVGDDFTLVGKNSDDLFDIIFSLRKETSKEKSEKNVLRSRQWSLKIYATKYPLPMKPPYMMAVG